MNQTQKLTAEIEVYQQEIQRLKSELAALNQSQKPPSDLSPTQIKDAYIAVAREAQERILSRQAIQDAIAVLEQIFSDKKAALAMLEIEEENTFRQRRLEASREKIECLIKSINESSELAERDLLELKTIFQEINPDYRALQVSGNPNPSAGWLINDLVDFRNVSLPIGAKQGSGYVIGSRNVNLYELEQSASLQRQAESARLRADRRAALFEEQQEKSKQEYSQQEETRLQVLLAQKQQLLGRAKIERQKYLSWGTVDVRDIDRTLATLTSELQDLEEKINQLREDNVA